MCPDGDTDNPRHHMGIPRMGDQKYVAGTACWRLAKLRELPVRPSRRVARDGYTAAA